MWAGEKREWGGEGEVGYIDKKLYVPFEGWHSADRTSNTSDDGWKREEQTTYVRRMWTRVHSIKKCQTYIIRYSISIKPCVLFRSKDSPRDKPNEDMFRHPCTFLIAKQKGDGPY